MAGMTRLAPLHLLTGAPGVGKTTLLPYLLEAAGGVVVADMDELLDDGNLLGVPIAVPEAAPIWPAYNRMWGRVVGLPRRAGHPVVLLCPVPDADELADGALWEGPIRWALLDCADQLRVRRLRARGWTQDLVDDALADAAQGRSLIPTVFATDDQDPRALAERVLAWVRGPA